MTSIEKPREVYLSACRELGSELVARGFRYAASRRMATRKVGDFLHTLSFQSSHYNVAGAHVALVVHAYTRSKRLGVWRGSGPRLPWRPAEGPMYDFVAGGQIGNLQPQAAWLEWNLAAPASRLAVLSEVRLALERLAFPHFEAFDDMARLITTLRSSALPSWDPVNALEFLLCFADQGAAIEHLGVFLETRPVVKGDYERALAAFRTAGATTSGSYGHNLAVLALAYQLAG